MPILHLGSFTELINWLYSQNLSEPHVVDYFFSIRGAVGDGKQPMDDPDVPVEEYSYQRDNDGCLSTMYWYEGKVLNETKRHPGLLLTAEMVVADLLQFDNPGSIMISCPGDCREVPLNTLRHE